MVDAVTDTYPLIGLGVWGTLVSLPTFCCGYIFQSDVVYGTIRVSLLAIFRDSTFNSSRPSWFVVSSFF
jgi:hypothetical protein